jgi:hypothetical protein
MKSNLIITELGTKTYQSILGFHREDGPALEFDTGRKEWWLNGKKHREDGPAVEHSGLYEEWWINGKLHREDGPALKRADGAISWFADGESLCLEEAINDSMLKIKYPKLIESMVIYLIYNS